MCSRSDLALIRPSAAALWWEKSSPQHCSAGAVCTHGCWCASPGGVSRGPSTVTALTQMAHTRPILPNGTGCFSKEKQEKAEKNGLHHQEDRDGPSTCLWLALRGIPHPQGQAVAALPSPCSGWDHSSVQGGACRAHRQRAGAGSQLCIGGFVQGMHTARPVSGGAGRTAVLNGASPHHPHPSGLCERFPTRFRAQGSSPAPAVKMGKQELCFAPCSQC